MVHITEDLIRRRAEHNDGELFSLEELSLHQLDIERIQHIDRWCSKLVILYLQNNLIPRIENLGHLKRLQYLNLALNNIEVIENLEGCESLQKLDLMVNFVGRLSSVESMRHNVHLRDLCLMGNPCSQFEGYRQYVVAALPQLQCLDGTEISRSERIQASHCLTEVRRRIQEEEKEYLKRRAEQKEAMRRKGGDMDSLENQDLQEKQRSSEADEERQEQEFWQKPCAFTPESRLQVHHHLQEKRKVKEKKTEEKQTCPALFGANGQVLNINEAKLNFRLTEDEDNNTIVLDLAVYRHMDTSLIDADVQPTYVRVSIKGKIFQIVLPAEVKPDSSTAQRSQTTGHLLLTMPLADGEIKGHRTVSHQRKACQSRHGALQKASERKNLPERLEVDPSKRSSIDFTNIVSQQSSREGRWKTPPPSTDSPSEEFMDDPDVPPLV
ncbi:tilB-like protein [Oryzias melastigma]|uniref:Leucine-rich repeat-containing protein 6 n=1 Tax=Oryzias melastigma TaxID=30732 RepID=A0A834BZX7_ORYME|nr:tilB-like protein [Oryzias melastigma]